MRAQNIKGYNRSGNLTVPHRRREQYIIPMYRYIYMLSMGTHRSKNKFDLG